MVTRLGPILCALTLAGCNGPAPDPHSTQAGDIPSGVDKAHGAIDATALRGLPGAAGVEVLVSAPRPANRIIHILDWHFVPRDLYAPDLRQAAGRQLSDREVDDRFRELVREVDAVQQDQEVILDALATRHDLRRVLVEGLTPKGVANYREVLSVFKATEDRIARLRESAAGLDPRPADIDHQVETMTRDLRERSLEYGAAGRLMGRGLIDVLPLDDADLLEAAKPVQPDGTVRFDPEKVEARHDGQVRRALAAGPCAVLVLGGAHDLSASVRRLGGGSTEYIRVTPKRYAAATGGR